MKTQILAAGLAIALLGSTAAVAQDGAPGAAMFNATTLNLSAAGEVKAAPDMASISIGVQTSQPTAQAAMAGNAAQMSRVIDALKRAGIDAKDIQTSALNLSPQYDYEQDKAPRLVGYQASNTVNVTVNDLAKLGPTLDAVVAVGANQINGISFGLKDSQAAEDAARLKAVKALRAKAELYASATGYRVGRLVSLSEGSGYVQPPRPLPMFRAAAAAAPSTPVEAGQLDVSIDVSGLYELTK